MQNIATGVSIKTLIASAGLAGGITIAGVYIPKRIAEKGLYIAGAIIGSTSVFTSLAFTEIIILKLGFDPEMYTMPIAFIIGGSSLFIINIISNWARKHEDNTVFEVIKDINKENKDAIKK